MLSRPLIVVLPRLSAEGCQHRDQRSERIGCGATKHSRVHFRLERLTKLAWLRPDIADLTPNG